MKKWIMTSVLALSMLLSVAPIAFADDVEDIDVQNDVVLMNEVDEVSTDEVSTTFTIGVSTNVTFSSSPVAAYSDASHISDSEIPSNTTVTPGDTIYLVANDVTDYSFEEWVITLTYSDGTTTEYSVSTYNLTVTVPDSATDLSCVANYSKVPSTNSDSTTVTIKVNGTGYYIDDSTEITTSDVSNNVSKDSNVEFKAENTDESFAYWTNSSGMILSTDTTYTFTATNSTTINLVRKIPTENTVVVTYLSHYDQELAVYQYDYSKTNIADPDVPSRLGYSGGSWELDSGSLKNNASVIYRATYSDVSASGKTYDVSAEGNLSDSIDISVTGGTTGTDKDGNTVFEFSLSDTATVTAPSTYDVDNNDDTITTYHFSHWETSAGVIVSYDSTYSFYVSGDTELVAVYVDDEDDKASATAIARMSFFGEIDDVDVAIAEFTAPSDYTIYEAGIEVFDSSGASLGEYTAVPDTNSYRHTLNFGSVDASGYSVRAVMRYSDGTNIWTLYSNETDAINTWITYTSSTTDASDS